MASNIIIQPNREEAFRLLHGGSEALARAEYQGIRVDVDYVEEQKELIGRRIRKETKRLESTKLMEVWREEFGEKTNLNSGPQLQKILFDKLGHKPVKYTAKENPSVDQESLESMGIPEIEDLVLIRKLQKVRGTYLENILREVTDGVLHPSFNLHTVVTFRSSSSNPNFQNIPIRIPWIGEIVRNAFVPRPGNQLLEIDYSGIEVCIAACYHLDPTMIEYISDNSKDMHRDMAGELYLLPVKEINKPIRYSAKNGFVFPEFYGDYFVDCAQALWKNITTLKLRTEGGVPLRKWLSSQGIRTYKKFEKHVEKVEKDFWEKRFPVYTDWKEEWLTEYQKKGHFDTMTGFRCSGIMRKNEVINYPIQGSAFHCLLWSLIELDKFIRKEKMNSRIVGQIHDSIIFDCDPKEVPYLLMVSNEIMTQRIRSAWDWINVPLEIEAELAPVNGTWHEKKEVKIAA